MKIKIMAFLLLIAVLFGVTTVSCIGPSSSLNNSDDNESTEGNTQGKENNENKFSGRIVCGTPFSEGLAVIYDGNKTYCIDKSGNIVYELNETYKPNMGGEYTIGYKNGLILINGVLYDKSGNATRPEDAGVTKFYDYALSGGYIVAVNEETTYNSSKKELGIMNTDFEWIVPLSEDLYESASKLLYASMYAYAIDGYIIDTNAGFVFEISTQKMYKKGEFPDAVGEHGWFFYTDGSFRRTEDEAMITVEGAVGNPTAWIGGKTVVNFNNDYKTFFTVIDKTGKLLFEPIEAKVKDSGWGYQWEFDGTYVCVTDLMNDSSALIYDTQGNLVGDSGGLMLGDIRIGDGVIVNYDIKMSLSSGTRTDVKYYNTNFEPLFD